LCHNFVAFFQNGVTKQDRRHNSSLKPKGCNITKRTSQQLYPSHQNEANIVVEKQVALRQPSITLFDDQVDVNQSSGYATKDVEEDCPSEDVVEIFYTLFQSEDTTLDCLQSCDYLLRMELASSL
jgi:hypothetical protein